MSCANAEDYITKSQINSANGVAGLNANKQVTADVNNAQVKISNQYQSANGSIINRPLVKLTPDNQSAFTLGKEMVQIGGDYDTNGKMVPMSLSVFGRPYGNYNAGCTLCIFSSASGMGGGGGQAAISGIDYRAGAPAVAKGDRAMVGFYQYIENMPARVVAPVASFDASGVTLGRAMTDEEMSQLHDGMYISTNVIDPTIKDTNNAHKAGLLHAHTYWGYIKSWDATHIKVYAWAASGGSTASGQVPNVSYLDDQLSTYKEPMVFVGVSNGVLAENTFMTADGSSVLGDNATSVSNTYAREELDFRAQNWTKPNSLLYQGWVNSFTCDNCDKNAVNEDSFAYLVNGGYLPVGYKALLDAHALEFQGYSTMIGSNGSPITVDDQGNIGKPIINSNHIMSSFESEVDAFSGDKYLGKHALHMSTIVNRDSTQANDWQDYSIRLVMDVDSQRNRRKGLTGGSRMGSIAFNYNHSQGNVCLLGYNDTRGLCQESDGSVNFAQLAQFNNKVNFNDTARIGKSLLFSSADYNFDTKYFSGQGSVFLWNTVNAGRARSELINVDPVNGNGGFDFYDVNSFASAKTSVPMLTLSPSGTVFNLQPKFNAGLSIAIGEDIWFQSNKTGAGFTISGDENGDMNFSTQMSNGANIRKVNGFYGKTATLTNSVSAPKIIGQQFHAQLSTPSSSSEACSAGDFKDDANYHYVCVANNKWKRVALSDF
ncbi:hypothetical protein [Commensalibacter nepenthis]|uniref:TonB-dependent receptor n=1 Tax=Commensalibacter nepenthis TaxID=3043872 RepID=A0ABT6Q756_9PROT|nr:hypothetical protein [Commensalibacter sp. TBRC 10068]MDI2112185.1 hypothetical protein [Commensalibacter sp. TBRC 10068]